MPVQTPNLGAFSPKYFAMSYTNLAYFQLYIGKLGWGGGGDFFSLSSVFFGERGRWGGGSKVGVAVPLATGILHTNFAHKMEALQSHHPPTPSKESATKSDHMYHGSGTRPRNDQKVVVSPPRRTSLTTYTRRSHAGGHHGYLAHYSHRCLEEAVT